MKLRRLAIAAALVIGAGTAVPVIASSAPAWAINCSYGDNFYHFVSDYSHDKQYMDSGNPSVLTDDGGNTSNDLFCQTNVTGGFSEWVKKGTSVCLTLDATISYEIDLKGCVAGKASQLWGLVDNQGGEIWGGIQSDYTSAGFRYLSDGLWGNGFDQGLTGWSPAPGSQWEWYLDGPYR